MRAIYPMALVVNGTKRILTGLVVAGAVMFLPHEALAKQGGTSILHFNFMSAMTNTGVDASGTVNGKQNSQGNASSQQLKISLANLDPNTAYQLVAYIGNDTNSTSVTNITMDLKGAFKVTYLKKGQGNTSAGKQSLPDALNPLRNVRELDIVNGTAQTVLQTDLTDPDKLQYLVKRPMDSTGSISNAVGSIQIKATTTSTQFRLMASGLTPTTDYVLTINGNAAQTNSSDGAGKLKLTALPQGAPDALDIHSVGLTDITGNLVLTAGGGSGGAGIPTEGQVAVALRSASTFAVMATASISGAGNHITGDVGLNPGSSQGIDPSEITGNIYLAGNPVVIAAQADLLAAYNDAVSRSVNAQTLQGNLGGLTKYPGLYVNSSSVMISGTGPLGILTLDAQGDANAVFIFKMASTLTTDPATSIVLSGGAQAKNVYWQVGSSATLGTTTIFKGNILAFVTITVNNGAVVEGRLFAGSGGDASGAVTVQSSTIAVPAP